MQTIFKWFAAVLTWFWCKLLKRHEWFTNWRAYSRRVEMEPTLTRFWVLTKGQTCCLCETGRTVEVKREIARDWQYPERLFTDKEKGTES